MSSTTLHKKIEQNFPATLKDGFEAIQLPRSQSNDVEQPLSAPSPRANTHETGQEPHVSLRFVEYGENAQNVRPHRTVMTPGDDRENDHRRK
jgi:hypothetical protein